MTEQENKLFRFFIWICFAAVIVICLTIIIVNMILY